MSDTKTVQVGDVVTFVDPTAQEHHALVIHVWGSSTYPDDGGRAPSINLVYVKADREDTYGAQTFKETSVTHQSMQSAPGMFWK